MTIALDQLPNYRPLHPHDSLLDDSIEKARQRFAFISKRDVRDEEIVRLQQERMRGLTDRAPYIGGLTTKLVTAVPGPARSIILEDLNSTWLTDMLADRYGIDFGQPDTTRPTLWRLLGHLHTPGAEVGATLNYQRWEGQPGTQDIHYLVDLRPLTGYANMDCGPSTDITAPLVGQGNVAHIPGFEAALTGDVAMLVGAALARRDIAH